MILDQAVTSDNSKISTSYRNVVIQHPNLNPAVDQVSLRVSIGGQPQVKNFTFNGQNTIKKKVAYTVSNNLAGIMYWDVAIDADYPHPRSLLKTVMLELGRRE